MATVLLREPTAVEEFVSKLKSRMQKLGVSPRALAEEAGVGYPYLYRVLKGEQMPSLDWAAKVGEKVGLQIRTVEAARARGKKSA